MSRWLSGFWGGSEGRKLTVNQFVLADGRTYRTGPAHETLITMCRHLSPEDPEALASKVFGENHAASLVARDKNNWRPTPANFVDKVQAACVEQGHGGLWNSPSYYTQDVVSIDMKACYPASVQGQG